MSVGMLFTNDLQHRGKRVAAYRQVLALLVAQPGRLCSAIQGLSVTRCKVTALTSRRTGVNSGADGSVGLRVQDGSLCSRQLTA